MAARSLEMTTCRIVGYSDDEKDGGDVVFAKEIILFTKDVLTEEFLKDYLLGESKREKVWWQGHHKINHIAFSYSPDTKGNFLKEGTC